MCLKQEGLEETCLLSSKIEGPLCDGFILLLRRGKIRENEWKLKVSTQYTGEFSKMNNSSHCSKDPHSDITERVLESMKIQYLNKMKDP